MPLKMAISILLRVCRPCHVIHIEESTFLHERHNSLDIFHDRKIIKLFYRFLMKHEIAEQTKSCVKMSRFVTGICHSFILWSNRIIISYINFKAEVMRKK